MARTRKQEDRTAKRNEIIAAAQHLIYTKGYENMTVQHIRNAIGMSNGAFFHYFDSKVAVLDAFIEQIREGSGRPLLALVQDPHLSALEKLQGYFDTLDQLRLAQQHAAAELLQVWYDDANSVVRQKVEAAVFQQRAPLVGEIVRQGIQEGVFTNPLPERGGEVILSLLQGMATTHAHLFLALTQGSDPQRVIKDIVEVHAAYMDAVERVLGAPSHSLYRTTADAVQMWVAAVQSNPA